MRHVPWSLTGPALLTLLACSNGNNAPEAKPYEYRNVVFHRANALSGSDLYLAPVDGSANWTNVTGHTQETVRDVWDTPVDGRLVYTATRAGTTNFYSVPLDGRGHAPGAPPFLQLTFESWPEVGEDDWEVVGKHIVARVTSGGVDNLYSVAIDGSKPLLPLTAFQSGAVHWPHDPWRERNALTSDGHVVFEHHEGTRRTVLATAADGSLRTPRGLSPADDATIAVDFLGRPMVIANAVVVREATSAGEAAKFSLVTANADNQTRVLTPPVAATTGISPIAVISGHFLWTAITTDIQNLFAVATDAAPGTNGFPEPRNLTGFHLPGSRVLMARRVPETSSVILIGEQPTGTNGIQADLFSVDAGNPATLRRLSRPIHTGVAAGDIAPATVVVCDDHVIYQRAATPATVWVARIGIADSETPLLPAIQTGTMAIDRALNVNLEVDRVTQSLLTDPLALRVGHVLIRVVQPNNTGTITNFWVATSENGLVRTMPLSSHRILQDGNPGPTLELRKGNRCVWRRQGIVYAADLTKPNSEINIVDTATSVERIFDRRQQGALDRVFYVANGNLFSTRIDSPAATSRAARRLTNLLPGQTIGEILFNTDTSIVFEVVSQNGIALHSSPIAPEITPAKTDIGTWSGGNDTFVLAF